MDPLLYCRVTLTFASALVSQLALLYSIPSAARNLLLHLSLNFAVLSAGNGPASVPEDRP